MRQKVRGLRGIERALLEARQARMADTETAAVLKTPAEDVVLDYCAAVRGILNDGQGGPLEPAGLRMASALKQVRASIQDATASGAKKKTRSKRS